jgi:uncharacterized protein (TIGR03435 family)
MYTMNRSRYLLPATVRFLAVAVPLLFGLVPMAQTCAQTQNGGTAAPLPKFAVAAIHPIKRGQEPSIIHVTFTQEGLFNEGVPLIVLMRAAFGVSEDRILGGPDWVRRDEYYIQAKVDAADVPRWGKLTAQERWAVVLALLEDRFGLKFHHETKDERAHTLVIAKGGPKLKKSSPTEVGKDGATAQLKASGSKEGLHLEMHGASMAGIVDIISKQLRGSVIDKTGLTGPYDFTLDYLPEGSVSVAESAISERPAGA